MGGCVDFALMARERGWDEDVREAAGTGGAGGLRDTTMTMTVVKWRP